MVLVSKSFVILRLIRVCRFNQRKICINILLRALTRKHCLNYALVKLAHCFGSFAIWVSHSNCTGHSVARNNSTMSEICHLQSLLGNIFLRALKAKIDLFTLPSQPFAPPYPEAKGYTYQQTFSGSVSMSQTCH